MGFWRAAHWDRLHLLHSRDLLRGAHRIDHAVLAAGGHHHQSRALDDEGRGLPVLEVFGHQGGGAVVAAHAYTGG